MCGFVAILDGGGADVDAASLRAATDVISHRGPDDHGYFERPGIGLGFRRLSIQDLSQKSHQPFEDSLGRYVIVFNGEIYNFVELRNELEGLGHSFRSSGDTEVLLTAYREWGQACVERFNGMWAFTIYDREDGSLFGSRDRFGIKPLYSSWDGQRRIFASEIKALFASGLVERRIDWQSATRYLVDERLSVPDEDGRTFFEGVVEVPAGHCFRVASNGEFRQWRFWDISAEAVVAADSPPDALSRLFRDAVKLRLRSDVPVGVCLSGGLDSTAIICSMAEELGDRRDEPLNAFSYIDKNFDETREVEATIEATKATLHRLSGDASSFLDSLQDVLWYHDEPLHSLNVLVSYELYRLAANSNVKVILNGQGADEAWAGYHSYFYNYWYGLYANGDKDRLQQEVDAYSEMHESNAAHATSKVRHMVWRNRLRRSGLYRQLSARRARAQALRHPWFSQELFKQYRTEVPDYESLDLQSELNKSVSVRPLPLYLRIEDRNSMAHSIETRLPFLDYRVVSLAANTAPEWLLRGGWNKYALREAMKGVMPEIVRTRPDKMGFPVSAKDWFAGALYESTRSLLSDQSAREHGLFNTTAILGDLERHRRGETDVSPGLLRVAQMQLLMDGVPAP